MNLGGEEWLGSCSGPNQFNLLNYSVIIKQSPVSDFAGVFDYHSTVVHEEGHWVRFHGTTIGAALALMRYAQQLTAAQFAALSSAEKDLLWSQRRDGRPIISLSPCDASRSDHFKLFRQFWLDLQIGYKMLLDSASMDDVFWDRKAAFESALTDAFLFMPTVYDSLLPIVSPASSPGTAISIEGPTAVYRTGTGRLTTRSLFECAATIDELFSVSNLAHYGDKSEAYLFHAAERVIRTLAEPQYGEPVIAYMQVMHEVKWENLRGHLATVLALIDFALNPPLPPAVESPVDVRGRCWAELYPPARFTAACHALVSAGIQPLKSDCSDDELRAFSRVLSEALGMADPFMYSGPMCATNGPHRRYSDVQNSGHYLFYLAEVQRKLWNLRLRDPSAVILYGQNMSLRAQERVELIIEHGVGWYRSPFFWTQNDTFSYTDPPGPDASLRYLGSLALHATLNNAMTQVGGLRKDQIPQRELPQGFWEMVRLASSERLGYELWL